MTTSATLAPVSGRCRWLARPDATGKGKVQINATTYTIQVAESGVSLTPDDRAEVTHHLPADLSDCTCGDHIFRAEKREDGLCKHQKAIKALLALPKPAPPPAPKPARKPWPCSHCGGTGRFRMNTRRGVRIEDCRWCNCTGVVEGF